MEELTRLIKILICDQIHKSGIEMLKKSSLQVDLDTEITSEKLLEKISEYDAIIIRGRTKITRNILDKANNLKVIARAGVGLDNIDLSYAKKKGIKVFNSPEATSNAVAELILGFIFNMARMINEANTSMKKGEWKKKQLIGFEVQGKTLGIIGFGRIGYKLGKKANNLGMHVLVYDIAIDRVRTYIDDIEAEAVDLDTLYNQSDFITVNVPLLPKTKYMIGAEEFEKMKKGVYIINTARGGVIDEQALKNALDSKIVRGAALDVFENEPRPDLDLVCREDVICTPHIGAGSIEAQTENSIFVAKKLIKYFKC